MGKKEPEIECLNRVINSSKSQHGYSRAIIDLLIGEDIERKVKERPDFIKRIYNKNSGSTIVGIEHFQVDFCSIKKKDGTIAGTTTKFNKDKQNIYNKYKGKTNDEQSMFEAVEDIDKLLADRLVNQKRVSYNNFLSFFHNVLCKHSRNIAIYRDEISKYALDGEDEKLIFLIDVQTEFYNLFINNGNKVKKNNSGCMLLTTEIVNLFSDSTLKGVDYVILCCTSSINTEKAKIYAFETNNAKRSLRKSGIRIYEYLGDDLLLDEKYTLTDNESINYTIEKQNDTYKTIFNYKVDEISKETRLNFAYYSLYLAHQARKNNEAFVTTLLVQKFLEIPQKNIKCWEISNNADEWWKVKPIFNISYEELSRISDDFEKKWDI